jgi:hypothetical protein
MSDARRSRLAFFMAVADGRHESGDRGWSRTIPSARRRALMQALCRREPAKSCPTQLAAILFRIPESVTIFYNLQITNKCVMRRISNLHDFPLLARFLPDIEQEGFFPRLKFQIVRGNPDFVIQRKPAMKLTSIVGAMAAIGMTAATVPAQAVETAFASYSPIGAGTNVRFATSSNSPSRTQDATFYTIRTADQLAAGSQLVNFSLLEYRIAPFLSNVAAIWTTTSSVAPFSNVPSTPGAAFTQAGISGSFSFITTSDITVSGGIFNTKTYLAGSNLLSGTFTSGTISSNIGDTSALGLASTTGGTLVLTSDFLKFTDTISLTSEQFLSSISPALSSRNATSNKALNSFFAIASGTYLGDGVRLANTVPEPQTWALLVVGFGLVGLSMRRRSRIVRTDA